MKQLRYLLILVIMFSCTATRQARTTPSLYSNDQEWKIKTDDGWFSAKTISFGPYTTSSRKNGVSDAMNASFIKDPKNPFSFTLTGNNERLPVQTMGTKRIAFTNRSLPAGLNDLAPDATIYYVLINGTGNDPLKRWELILKTSSYLELNDNKAAGILRSSDTDIRITAHNRFGKVNSYENICYEFQYRGQPVAAVMPGSKPRIWVSKDADADISKPVAAAIAAILLRN
ncbi:MAG TPA: hypothetical protein VM802_24265 [Chitinophaga sp.]|uniref:hypothetical protein n=1 Tax=Chitinophaga sp. TaxID=1869181 RepID=UPI002C3C9869|nr:hypothetical protein [Chitinophaga sp.]HVI48005.1 hypothetical protein [Chitinophaga sp.]